MFKNVGLCFSKREQFLIGFVPQKKIHSWISEEEPDIVRYLQEITKVKRITQICQNAVKYNSKSIVDKEMLHGLKLKKVNLAWYASFIGFQAKTIEVTFVSQFLRIRIQKNVLCSTWGSSDSDCVGNVKLLPWRLQDLQLSTSHKTIQPNGKKNGKFP